jgi:hypothetical protein
MKYARSSERGKEIRAGRVTKAATLARPNHINPGKKDWFVGSCAEVGLDPEKVTIVEACG